MSVLVPIDLSEVSATAVEFAARVCLAAGAREVMVLHAADHRSELAVLARLYDLARPLRDAGLRARIRTVANDPVQAICEAARAPGCSFVIMGVCGLGGAGLEESCSCGVTSDHLHPGRVAARVLQQCPVPVAAVWHQAGSPQSDALVLRTHQPGAPTPAVDSLAHLVARALGLTTTIREQTPAEIDTLLRHSAGPLVVVGGAIGLV